ncbi:hypothetical protein BOW86_gp165 [Synechococcus phage S-CAM7]|uniref:Uncharacterized protein n=1 Tax=Synechococcus phage S-CAM7 TaxID=1883368 RepID=A0A1D8KTX9_9CAUD|nr:hypothetical protein BOW86_gp165 [Synechococcus phage S-CAM7]AOV62089.1 hypothetical protein C490910_165 [Synechococcus phage S-CAM7]QLF86217.1 hypothetical protein CC030809_00161 [Synechococcus phage S-CAM7]
MSGITTYRWADELGEYLVGITTDPGVQYTIPTLVGNRDYDTFVALGVTALPYVPPVIVHSPDYMAFWIGLISSPYYVKVKTGASTDLQTNTSATEFIALMGDAKGGMRIESALQTSFDELLTLVPADAADQLYLDNLLVQTHLDQTFTLNY